MIVRKIFESIEYYKSIQKWDDKGNPLSKSDKDVIVKTFPDILLAPKSFVDHHLKFIYKMNSKGSSRPGKYIILKIYSNEDEWYYLKVKKRIVSPFDGEILDEDKSYYQCDQLEGLIKCIKDKVI